MKNVLSRSYQRGLSMIEVLVAVVIISLGLLGMAGLQASGMRTSQSAFYRAQAAQFTNDMAERMRANLGDARNYTLALTATAPTGTSVQLRASPRLARMRSAMSLVN